jgi:hypothetical protein
MKVENHWEIIYPEYSLTAVPKVGYMFIAYQQFVDIT